MLTDNGEGQDSEKACLENHWTMNMKWIGRSRSGLQSNIGKAYFTLGLALHIYVKG